MLNENREITVEEIARSIEENKMSFFHEKLEGRVNVNGGVDVNISTSFSALIKEAGKCNSYNSDVFYDLLSINNRLENFDFNDEEHYSPILIGFRKLGVDGNAFVRTKVEERSKKWAHAIFFPEEYFSVFAVTFKKSKEWSDMGYIEINVTGVHV
jgi:hypothetical protein